MSEQEKTPDFANSVDVMTTERGESITANYYPDFSRSVDVDETNASTEREVEQAINKKIAEGFTGIFTAASSPVVSIEQVPTPSFAGIKSLLSGKGMKWDYQPLEITPVDMAVIGLVGSQAAANTISIAKWNNLMNKGIETQQIYSTVYENLPSLEKAMESGGFNIGGLSDENKVRVILSQAEKSATMSDTILDLLNKKIIPKKELRDIVDIMAVRNSTDIPAEQLSRIKNTINLLPEEKTDIMDTLGLAEKQIDAAIKTGLPVNVPTQNVAILLDKPYWERTKEELSVKLSQPQGEGKIEMMKVADIPDRAKAIGMSKKTFDTLSASVKESGVEVPLLVDSDTGRVIDGQHRAFVADSLGIEEVPVMKIKESDYTEDQIESLSNKLNDTYSGKGYKARPEGGVKAGGQIAQDLTPKEKEQLATMKPDSFKIVTLDRDVEVKMGDTTRKYKKGENIYIYQDNRTGRAIVKDGDYGILPKKEVTKVEQAGDEIGEEFAPELKGVEIVTKGKQDEKMLDKLDNRLNKISEKLEKLYDTRLSEDDTSVLSDRPVRTLEMHKEIEVLEKERQKLLNEAKVFRGGKTKFSQLQLPGGENYREVLIKAPLPKETKQYEFTAKKVYDEVNDIDAWQVYRDGKPIGDLSFLKTEKDAIAEVKSMAVAEGWPVDTLKGTFRSSHWEEPNVVAHIRLNDRTTADGKKVLFIEEIQSDWAREVRKEPPSKNPAQLRQWLKEGSQNLDYPQVVREGMAKQANMSDEDLKAIFKGGEMQGHPLLKNWQELALKRVLEIATKGGYDEIAWTTGEQQAARYDLSEVVSTIRIYDDGGTYAINGWYKGERVLAKENIPPSKLGDFIGKDRAKKVLDGTAPKSKDPDDGDFEFSGEDLKIGGEWAKNLYDKQIPNILKDLTKGEIGEVKLGKQEYIQSEDPVMDWDIGKKIYARSGKGWVEVGKGKNGAEQLRALVDNNEELFIKSSKLSNPSLELTPQIKSKLLGQPKAGGTGYKKEDKQELIASIKEMQKSKELSGLTLSRLKKFLTIDNLKAASIDQLTKLKSFVNDLDKGDKFLSAKQLEALQDILKDLPAAEITPKRIIVDKFGEKSDILIDKIIGRFEPGLIPAVDIKDGHPLIKKVLENARMKLYVAAKEVERRDANFEKLISAAEKSRSAKLTLKEKIERRLVPQDKEIFRALSGEKVDLTKEEAAVVAYLKNFFKKAREDLQLEKYRKNYVTHMEKTLSEKIVSMGMLSAIRDALSGKKSGDIPIDIMLELDNIIGSEKFFRFALQRKGGLDPTTNLRQILHTYSNLYETKMALDSILPEGQAITKTLLQGKSALWMKQFLQNLKGRGLDFRVRNGPMGWLTRIADGIIDVGYWKLLGLNWKSALKNVIAGETNSWIYQDFEKYVKGKRRFISNPKKAYELAKQYGILEGTFADYAQKGIGKLKKLQDLTMIGQQGGEIEIRGSIFVSMLTDKEWESGVVSPENVQKIKDTVAITQGIFSNVDSPLILQTWYGRMLFQMNRWRITNAMLLRRITNNAADDVRAGKYNTMNVRRLIKTLVAYGIGMYISYELGKAGYKKAADIAQNMAQTIDGVASLFTEGDLIKMFTENPTLSVFKELSNTIQNTARYLKIPGATKPRGQGIEETYIAPIENVKDIIEEIQ